MNIVAPEREKSKEVYEASLKRMPGGVNSPVRAFPGLALTPLVIERGVGDTIIDADRREYIDFCMSWGALILGHAAPVVVSEAQCRMSNGFTFGTMTNLELKFSEKIHALMPWMEKLRFVSSGTEATMAAIRLARGYTGKKKIIKCIGGYHGSADCLLTASGSGVSYLNPQASSAGVPEEAIAHTISLPYNDVEALERCFAEVGDEVAGMILEPIAGNMGTVPATKEYLQAARKLTQKSQALLIFDEVISGFRVSRQGAQPLYDVYADLTCLGKIVGGGMPAAAFGGKAEIMDFLAPLGQVYHAGTLSGNPVAMAAGFATLKEIEKPGFYERLDEKTGHLLNPLREEIAKRDLPAVINQVGSMFTLFFGPKSVTSKSDLETLDHARFEAFFLHMLEKGIYFPPSAYEAAFISSAHTEEHLQKTTEAILEFFQTVF